MRRLIILAEVALGLLFASCTKEEQRTLSVMPAPLKVELQQEVFSLNSEAGLYICLLYTSYVCRLYSSGKRGVAEGRKPFADSVSFTCQANFTPCLLYTSKDIESSLSYFGSDYTIKEKKSLWSKAATLMLKADVYPVSYTHLDVYKRQALKWDQRSNTGSAVNWY